MRAPQKAGEDGARRMPLIHESTRQRIGILLAAAVVHDEWKLLATVSIWLGLLILPSTPPSNVIFDTANSNGVDEKS